MRFGDLQTVLAALLGIGGLAVGAALPLHAQAPFGVVVHSPGAQIGATVRDLDASESERRQVQAGAVIDEVRRDSPAEKAGLRSGDLVVEFDGEHVRSARHLARLVEETPPGRTVKTTVVRDGRRTDMSITPSRDRRPDVSIEPDQFRDLAESFPKDFNFDFDLKGFGSRGRLGVTVDELTPQLADYFGARDGVLITAVTADTPAARAGLKAGDVITKVGETVVRSRSDLTFALREVRDAGDVEIGIVRDRQESTVKATLDAPRRPTRSSRRTWPA
jgi:serine protease Do